MAYAAVVTYENRTVGGKKLSIVTVVETGLTTNAHEYSFTAFRVGTVIFHRAVFTAGTGDGTTVDPQLQEAASGTAIWANGAAAAAPRNLPDALLFASASVLYGRSVSNNTNGGTASITTTIIMQEGRI